MTIPVLVVDADEEYRNLTIKTLDGSGQYQAIPAESGRTALTQIATSKAQIAIIDTGIGDNEVDELVKRLLEYNKHLLIIAIVEEENGVTEHLLSQGVRSILHKPFFLPELPMIITSVVHGSSPQGSSSTQKVKPPTTPEKVSPSEIPVWLSDQDQANDYLTRLYEEHSAEALVLIRGTFLWARSSQLPGEYARQITKIVLDHEDGQSSKKSIVGYVRIGEQDAELLLYATPLEMDFMLILLYDTEKPFSLARRQARYVGRLILTQDPAGLPPPVAPAVDESTSTPSKQPTDSTLPSDWIPQSPASVEDFPQLTDTDIPAADPEIGPLEQAAIGSPAGIDLPSLPTDWFPKRPTPSSHLPFLTSDEPEDQSMTEDSDQEEEDSSSKP